MPCTQTAHVPKPRLAQELQALGMDSLGSRAELMNRLEQAGVYEINTELPPRQPKVDTVTRFPNHSSVLLGNGAQIDTNKDEKFVVCNKQDRPPLITGDFKESSLCIHNCLSLDETPELSADTPGEEGHIRMHKGHLYMYRSNYVYPGWYPLQFGSMLLI